MWLPIHWLALMSARPAILPTSTTVTRLVVPKMACSATNDLCSKLTPEEAPAALRGAALSTGGLLSGSDFAPAIRSRAMTVRMQVGTTSIIDTIASLQGFGKFAAALQANGIELSSGEFTVLVPSDAAFDQHDKSVPITADLLKYHILPGRKTLESLTSDQETLEGGTLKYNRRLRKNWLDNAQIGLSGGNWPADVEAANGVIHTIDTVLVPGGLTVAAEGSGMPPPPSLEAEARAAFLAKQDSGFGPGAGRVVPTAQPPPSPVAPRASVTDDTAAAVLAQENKEAAERRARRAGGMAPPPPMAPIGGASPTPNPMGGAPPKPMGSGPPMGDAPPKPLGGGPPMGDAPRSQADGRRPTDWYK